MEIAYVNNHPFILFWNLEMFLMIGKINWVKNWLKNFFDIGFPG